MSKTEARKKYRVGRSSAGLGLFAGKRFKRGDFVSEYTGKRISADEADKRGGRYLFDIDKKWTIDGTGRGNTARYMNHACKPNCEAVIDGMRIKIYARRKIKAGEELTYNYGKEYFDDWIKPAGCKCLTCAPCKATRRARKEKARSAHR